MIQQLAEILAQQIRDSGLVTVAGGLASPWKSNDKDKGTKAAYWDYEAGEHRLLVPDADKAVITYFEEAQATEIMAGPITYRAHLILVGWANTSKGVNTPQLIGQLQTLFKQVQNQEFNPIKVRFTALLPESEQLFSRYKYDSAVRKYLHKPYDAFGLRMEVTFNVCP